MIYSETHKERERFYSSRFWHSNTCSTR